MNQKRRESLRAVLVLLSRAETTIDLVMDEERDSIENMPESLQSSDKVASMENAVDCLSDAIDGVQEAANYINNAINTR